MPASLLVDLSGLPLASPDLVMVPTIDWLTISQDHEGVPEYGGDFIRCVDSLTGETRWESLGARSVPGSFSASVQVRSHGGRVRVSGNPSKLLDPSGLDGARSMSEAVRAFDSVLQSCGLPVFSFERSNSDRFAAMNSPVPEGKRFSAAQAASLGYVGAQLSRVDVCICLSAGSSADLRSFMVSSSLRSYRGKGPRVFGEHEALYWGPPSRTVKLYCKGLEMRANGGPALNALADWGIASGLVRHERRLLRRELVSLGLHTPYLWCGSAMSDVLDDRRPFVGAVEQSSVDHVFDALMILGLSRQRAARAHTAFLAYRRGSDLRAFYPLSTWYQVRKDLRLVGFDISVPVNVTALNAPVRTIELKPAVLPARFRRENFTPVSVAPVKVPDDDC